MNQDQVSISQGNIKMGSIPSVSVSPYHTCDPSCPCWKDCYARRMTVRRRTILEAWERNFRIYKENKDSFFSQVSAACFTTKYFRWHVGGDIVDDDYFKGMIEVANQHKDTKFLAFTKKYEIVNKYLDEEPARWLPDNLKIIFSRWKDWTTPNPYGLPEAQVIFKDTAVGNDWKICGGNCTECACRGIGCWEINPGETIAFYKH